MSLFSSLHIARKGIMASQIGMQVTGHNIANVNTEGYSRQKVDFSESHPVKMPQGIIGMGVDVVNISRVRDTFIDYQIRQQKASQGYYDQVDNFLSQVEAVFSEPGEIGLNQRLDRFWNSWQELNKYPSSSSIRITVAEEGAALAKDINAMYRKLDMLKSNANDNIKITVDRINTIAEKIASLNDNIVKYEANGSSANDFRDQRDMLVEELARYVNIEVVENQFGSINVYIPGYQLVSNIKSMPLGLEIDNTLDTYRADLYRVVAGNREFDINVLSGSLKAMVDVRDELISSYQRNLDYLALFIADNVNEVHSSGYDLQGNRGLSFFEPFPSDRNEIYRITSGTNLKDISDINLPLNHPDNLGVLTVAGGLFSINGKNIAINPETDSLKSIVEKINSSQSGVIASIGPQNELVLRGDKDSAYKIESLMSGTSNFLEKMNILPVGGSFPENALVAEAGIVFKHSQSPALKMSVNHQILNNPNRIAAAVGKDSNNDGTFDSTNAIYDGTNALLIGRLRESLLLESGRTTVNGFYRSMVTTIGFDKERVSTLKQHQNIQLRTLEEKRESISGVSLDEEMTNMIQFQHAFSAAARFMAAVQEMLDTLINRI